MTEKIPFIFDKVFKLVITLSRKAVINLINALFGTHYPADSTVEYNWTESVDNTLKRTLSDTIITINHVNSYHLEAQMTHDKNIVFRVFEYGFRHAGRTVDYDGELRVLRFPEPRIIYLYSETEIPEKYTLRLQFEKQQHFDYEVSTANLQNVSVEELHQRKLILLIPFQLLKMRTAVQKKLTPEVIEQLKNLLFHDILEGIQNSVNYGDITPRDASRLLDVTGKLLHHLYDEYEDIKKEVCNMYDQSLELEVHKYFEQIDALEEELSQKDELLSQKDEALSQQARRIAELEAELAKRN